MGKLVIRDKKGIGVVVLLNILMISAIAGTIIELLRVLKKPALKRVPRLIITDKLSFGNALFWGIIFGAFGLLLLLSLSFAVKDDLSFLILFVVPLIITGFLLIIEWFKYKVYITTVSAYYNSLPEKISVEKDKLFFTFNGKTLRYEKLIPILHDLYDNRFISLSEHTDIIIVNKIDPSLKVESSGIEEKEIAWECTSCGANNKVITREKKDIKCAYCGSYFLPK